MTGEGFRDPSAGYPGTLLSRGDVGLLSNRITLTLAADVTSTDDVIPIQESVGEAPDQAVITINDERIKYTSRDTVADEFTQTSRGVDGSPPASHAAGDAVEIRIPAHLHNRTLQELISVQGELGTDPSGNATSVAARLSGLASPSYVALASDSALDNERSLATGAVLDLNDAGAGNDVTVSVNVNGLTEISSVDGSADFFLVYDRSQGKHRKVTGDNLPGGAPPDAPYVTVNSNDDLSAERVLAGGPGLSVADGSAEGNVTANLDVDSLTTETSTSDADKLLLYDNANADHRNVAVSDLPHAPDDAPYVTLTASTDLANERTLNAGPGLSLTDDGANSDATLDADFQNMIRATESGTVADSNEGVLVIDRLADGDDVTITKAGLTHPDGTAVPAGVDLVIVTLSGGTSTTRTTILSGDGSTIHDRDTTGWSWTNNTGSAKTIAVVVANASGASQDVVAYSYGVTG
jgi:hypothetical protein